MLLAYTGNAGEMLLVYPGNAASLYQENAASLYWEMLLVYTGKGKWFILDYSKKCWYFIQWKAGSSCKIIE